MQPIFRNFKTDPLEWAHCSKGLWFAIISLVKQKCLWEWILALLSQAALSGFYLRNSETICLMRNFKYRNCPLYLKGLVCFSLSTRGERMQPWTASLRAGLAFGHSRYQHQWCFAICLFPINSRNTQFSSPWIIAYIPLYNQRFLISELLNSSEPWMPYMRSWTQ